MTVKKKDYIEELKTKLDLLERNLLFCFNGKGDIYDAFEAFKKKFEETAITSEDITKLNEINNLLTPFIKNKEKCIKKGLINNEFIKSKSELGTQLIEIRNILESYITK